MLTDNGCIFTAQFRNGRCGFETELATLGIAIKHGKPYHPQTQGKIERFHKTLKRWLRKQDPATSIAELQGQVDYFVRYYNETRPTRPGGWSRRSRPSMPWKGSPRPSKYPMAPTPGSATTRSTSRGLHPASWDQAPSRGGRAGPQGPTGHRLGGGPLHQGPERGRRAAPPPHARPARDYQPITANRDDLSLMGSSVHDVSRHHIVGARGLEPPTSAV